MNSLQNPFCDPAAVATYAEGPPRFVPGYNAMLSMATILVAERAPENARVLVLGAGGGLELKAFAQAHASWVFDGIDPSAPMLELAAQTLGSSAPRARLHHGYIDDAPPGPFDGATCLLTLHSVGVEERRRRAVEIRRRLKPRAVCGCPLQHSRRRERAGALAIATLRVPGRVRRRSRQGGRRA